jgi:hypothetical protein
VPDELSAWAAHRAAVFNTGYFEEFSQDLTPYSHSMVPGGLWVRS